MLFCARFAAFGFDAERSEFRRVLVGVERRPKEAWSDEVKFSIEGDLRSGL